MHHMHFRMLRAFLPAFLMRRMHFRMLRASLRAFLMRRMLFRKLHLPSCSRPHSILQCLLMP
jgi:hypothetical protein